MQQLALGLGIINQLVLSLRPAWLNEQLNAMLYANNQALKGIHKSTKCNRDRTSGKDITIPVGNHVLLCDHPEGHNKIQVIGTVYCNYHHPALIIISIISRSSPEDPATLKSGARMSYMDLCMPSQA